MLTIVEMSDKIRESPRGDKLKQEKWSLKIEQNI